MNEFARAAGRPPRERAWIVAAVLVVAAAAGGYVAWRHYARPADRRYAAVIDLLGRDPSALPLDARDRIDLAQRFPGLTPHDEMFVTRLTDGSRLVLFPTYYGSGATMAGLLYTPRPLREGDTYVFQPSLGIARRAIDVGNYHHMNIDDRVDDHWYHVSYRMH